jgi:WD40 repeat protein
MTPSRFPSGTCLLLFLLAAPARGGDPPARLDAAGDPLPPHARARLGTTRWRQQISVVGLAYSADGKALVCGTYEEGIGVFDAATGRKVRHLFREKEGVPAAVAVSADGRRVAGMHGHVVRVFDAATGAGRGQCTARANGPAAGLVLSPDGKHFVTLHWPDRVRLWDADTGAERPAFQPGATAAAFGDGGKTLLGNHKRVRVWDLAARKEVRRLEGEARRLAASADGRTLAARGKRAVRLWDPTTGEEKRSLPVPDDQLHVEASEMLALSADGRTVALAGAGHLFAWDCATGRERFRSAHRSYFTAALSPDGRTLAWAASGHPVIHRWDLDAGRELLPCPGHENHIHGLAFAPDGQALASGASDGTVRLWQLNPARARGGRPGCRTLPTGEVAMPNLGGRVAWSPDGRLLALARSDDEICSRDAATGAVVRTLAGTEGCHAVAFSPDGKLLAVGDSYNRWESNAQGRVLVWETATGRLVRTFKGHGKLVTSVAFSPDGRRLASGGDGACVWDLASGKQVRRFPGSGNFTYALAFSPDGRELVAGGKEAVVWDLSSGEELCRRGGRHRWVAAVALSPDGRLLATAGEDGLVRLWDFAGGAELAALAGHLGRAYAVAFSPDGQTLASGGEDTTVLLWDVPAAARGGGTWPRGPLTRADLARLWDDLGKAETPAGHRAVWALAEQPAAAVALLEERLPKAARAGDPARVARLIRQLDDDDFDKREEASRELDRLGGSAVPALHEALARGPSAEVRRRIRQLLADRRTRSDLLPRGDGLRITRAIHVLELIGTRDARRVLEALAHGPPSRGGGDARAALRRLDRRTEGRR